MYGTVYLLHFARPIGNLANRRGHAQHYLGWASDLESRLQAHHAGRGAAITRAAILQGVSFDLVASWPGSRELEKALKALKAGPRLCPHCGRRHPRGPLCVSWRQLDLPLDDWPAPPPGPAYGWPGYFAPGRTNFGLDTLDTSRSDIPF